ncbi:alkaline phosphatase family protein [Salarchaeum sp. JOR-1]|uniref:alkaline phosphatase family protein n=1 Tax=Salarchaeum sp. JOR-1 TaxID=2599399 RepID=UPI00119843A0|nr:alkaline phosphatase family protein [Salarchaeum sp. JOR-1]QDX41788.1 nucleotide pyrophosphatase [Salarchaeum sp. JOR-1]
MGLFDKLRGDTDKPRVAFLGIDGVPDSLIQDNPDVFPNLHALSEDGASGEIESIVPPESSACWPALTTGVNPGETGVYGFQDRENGSYETYVPMGRDVQATRVWDRVTDAGRDATVVNVPVTFPPQGNLQRMVSGFLSPGIEKASSDQEVAEYLESIDYRIDANAKLGHQDDKSAFIENAHETLDARYEAFSHYIAADDWDLFFGVFMTTDRVNHFLYGDYAQDGEYKEEFLDFYEKVDEYIGRLRDQLPDDVTLIVASDHGFQTEAYEVYLNTWLHAEGWLDFRTSDPENLDDISSETKAYSFIPGRFYLNLDGREPRGSVPQADYDDVRNDLAAKLESLTGPDGDPVIERVVTKADAFAGPHDDIAPDLVAIPREGFDLKAGFSDDHDVFEHGPRNGMHSFDDATLFVDDPAASIADTNLYDITPTILDLMEMDYDQREFDGTSLV